ncbi:hypothetical protein ABZP36_009188 [Zizania latifolia]
MASERGLMRRWEWLRRRAEDDDNRMAIGLAEDDNKGDANKATVVVARSALSARQRRMSGLWRVKSKNGAMPFAVSRGE